MPQKLPNHTYLEMGLSCARRSPFYQRDAEHFWAGLGIAAKRLVLSETKMSLKISCYTRSIREVKKVTKAFYARKQKGLQLKVRVLGRRDWLDKWKRYYRPTPVGERFIVVPLWEKEKSRSGNRMPLYIEPGGAFGSGLHETTRLVLTAMEKLSGRFQTFLDIGTGTGILAAAAVKLGARKVLGIDNDKQSIKVAKINFKVNGGRGGRFLLGDLTNIRLARHHDLVAANLLSRTLIENGRKICSAVKPGGYLLVSGIHKINLRDFLRSFPSAAFASRKVINGRSWSAVLWRRD